MSDLIKTLRQEASQENAEYLDEDYRTQAANLIEKQQARIDELATTVERLRDIAFPYISLIPEVVDWFDNTPQQNLNAVRREAFIEGFNAGFTDCWIVDEEEHADAAIEIASQLYPDKE